MRFLWLVIAVLALLVRADKSIDGPAVEELNKLQGTWNFVSFELDGVKLPEAMLSGSKIIINGDTFKSITGGVTYLGTIRLDVAKNPKTIDLIFTEGPEKGNTSLGIYEVAGDDLKICLSLAGRTRPT